MFNWLIMTSRKTFTKPIYSTEALPKKLGHSRMLQLGHSQMLQLSKMPADASTPKLGHSRECSNCSPKKVGAFPGMPKLVFCRRSYTMHQGTVQEALPKSWSIRECSNFRVGTFPGMLQLQSQNSWSIPGNAAANARVGAFANAQTFLGEPPGK